jgi:hypothetical protein
MKAHINRDGMLVLSPDSPTEEYALVQFLAVKQIDPMGACPAIPLDFIFVEDCDE